MIVMVDKETDSSQYPNDHTYFGYSEDAGALESEIARVIDELPAQTGCSLREVMGYFVKALSCSGEYDSEEDDDDEADYMMLDEAFDSLSDQELGKTPQISLSHLKKCGFSMLLDVTYIDPQRFRRGQSCWLPSGNSVDGKQPVYSFYIYSDSYSLSIHLSARTACLG